MKAIAEIPVAVVLRYSDNMLGEQTSTVQEHNKVVREEGKAWFGKFGRGFAPLLVRSLNKPEVSLTLIVVRSRKRITDDSPRVFGATCSGCQTKRPPAALIPGYYRHLNLDTWFCLTSELKPLGQPKIEQWLVISSAQPLMPAPASTPKSFFLMTTKPHLAQARTALGIKATMTYSAEDGIRRLGRPRRGSAKPRRTFEDEEDYSQEDFT